MAATNDLSVHIPVSDLDGFGDIVAGVSFAEYFQTIGFPFQVSFTSSKARKSFAIVAGKHKFQKWSKKKSNRRKIVICPVQDKRDLREGDNATLGIIVNEYDLVRTSSNYGRKLFVLDSGFGFDRDSSNVQSGIYLRPSLEFLVKSARTAIEKGMGLNPLRNQTIDLLEEKVATSKYARGVLERRREEIVNSRWALAYLSLLGEDITYFKILKAAESKLDSPLTVFSTAPTKNEQSDIKELAVQEGFNYLHLKRRLRKNQTHSPITLLELGSVPESVFMQFIAYADTLSLITGDHSLSQMIQRNFSGMPLPFLYKMANWKRCLANNFRKRMGKTDQDAANMFASHQELQNNHFKYYVMKRSPRDTENKIERLSQLIYDRDVAANYTRAVAGIKDHFIAERKEAGIEEAELLWCIQDTVGYIVQRAMAGLEGRELVAPLLPKTNT